MRMVASVVLVAFSLTACGGEAANFYPGVAMANVSLTAPVSHLISFNDAGQLASYQGSPVVPLFAVPAIQTSIGQATIDFWGVKDSTGNITQLTEAGVKTPAGTVHVLFDTSERPIFFRDDASGYGFKLSYDSASQETVTLCDASGVAVANSVLSIANGSAVASDAVDGGSCALPATAATAARRAASGTSTDLTKINDLAKLITAGAYVAGMGFALGAIMKFKAHKDNPTTSPIGTPIALLFVAAALMFLPSIFNASGAVLFDSYSDAVPADGLATYASLSS